MVRQQSKCGLMFVLVFAIGVSLSAEQTARAGVCEREAEQLVGQKPVRVGRSVRPPKKLRDVNPKLPDLPPGTLTSSFWHGEALINSSGKILRVWSVREAHPAVNNAITDAIKQWEYEPVLVKGKPAPVCLTVTVNINLK